MRGKVWRPIDRVKEKRHKTFRTKEVYYKIRKERKDDTIWPVKGVYKVCKDMRI